jgi:hypothetical protein
MLQNDLFALVRSVILAGLTARSLNDVAVRAVFQPQTVGTAAGPQVTIQAIGDRRYGALGRRDLPATNPLAHAETQWWETTLQIGALAHRDPNDPDFMTLPSAMDICKAASDILQGDAGLAALAVQRVRPIRVTSIRNVQWVNDSDQYEAMPNFDLVLVYPQTNTTTTPPVSSFEPVTGRV